jgi:ABC-2 type transport system ATP-binding protein
MIAALIALSSTVELSVENTGAVDSSPSHSAICSLKSESVTTVVPTIATTLSTRSMGACTGLAAVAGQIQSVEMRAISITGSLPFVSASLHFRRARAAPRGSIPVIVAQNLTKRFGTFTAVEDVCFEVGTGQIVGFIGPNGAGKTTTMRMLTGFIPATAGSAQVAGFDVFESTMDVRRSVGYLPESPPLYMDLSVGQYLQFIAEIRGLEKTTQTRRIGEVMEAVGLTGFEKRLLGSLSKGYRQRVGLAQAIIHDPSVLILDEPTSGLDPKQLVGIRSFIKNLAADRTVILSTHILSEVEALCDRAIVIDGGRVVADDTLDGLRDTVGEGVRYRVELRADGHVATALGGLPAVSRVDDLGADAGVARLGVHALEDPRTEIARLAKENGWAVHAMERHAPSLEEAFLGLIGDER